MANADGSPADPFAGLTVVVLAGGGGRRFGGDKLAASVSGATVLDTLLAGLPTGVPVVVVGPERATSRTVRWVVEDPPGGGPLAGVVAGLALVDTALVALVAGDMPLAGRALPSLLEALSGSTSPGAVAVDASGRANPLLSLWHTGIRRAHLPEGARGRPARVLLDLEHVEVPVDGPAARDIDTVDDLEAVRADLGDAGTGVPND